MLTIRKILHPTDFSNTSEAALELAGGLARDYDAELLILHVVPPPMIVAEGVMMAPPPPAPDLCAVREQLHNQRPQVAEVPVRHLLVEGNAVDEILRAAEDNSCDLIVMGTHGRRALARVVMGSVAENTVRRAPCAVVTIRQPLSKPKLEPTLETVGAVKRNGDPEC